MSSRLLAGRYELLEKIGDGGMAVVYKARCRLLKRFVAIKILKPEFTKDVKFIESFRRESQAAASLSHPNIVNVFDVGQEGNIYYIVMELVEGQVLSDIIKNQGPFEPTKAIEITKQIASALVFAHKNHIIHRDVKPHNILMTTEGDAKITDFGIAKAVNEATIVGNTGMVMGSVHYFSPEQARGGYVDEKTDIYSLGIVLYELLTGKVPFDAENPVAVALMHMNDPMVPPSSIRPGINKALEEIVMKATNKYQINRYKSATEMVEALEKVQLNMAANNRPMTSGSNLDATRVMAMVNEKGEAGQGEKSEGTVDDMKGTNNNKPKKKVKINKIKVSAIILALIVAIPISHLILSGVNSIFSPEEIIVPDLKGKTFEEAEEMLEPMKLKVEVNDEVLSTEYEEGLIVSQDPEAEMTVREGFTVKVNISKAVRAGRIPDVKNRTFEDAKFLIQSYGFEVGSTSTENSDLPKDVVIRQSPSAETEAAPGTAVNLVISLGKAVEQVSMPNLMGLDFDAAKAELEKNKLKLGTPSYEMSTIYAQNQVMWQQYDPGTLVDAGTAVNLKISSAQQVPGPKSVALTVDYGQAKNEVFYITVVISDDGGVRTVINRELRLKEDGSEILSLSGEGVGMVKVLFDNDVVIERSVNFNTGTLN